VAMSNILEPFLAFVVFTTLSITPEKGITTVS
jgi:hypothetical protein